MGVFLRWGVFGIIAVAALVYAYNALGHLADRHKAAPAAVVAPPAAEKTTAESAKIEADAEAAVDDTPPLCRVELDVAQRAVESRSIGEPLDRLLRIQEIAWEKDDKRRDRLTTLATRWYDEPGPVDPARLRQAVIGACETAMR
jgi:hypothetical protein